MKQKQANVDEAYLSRIGQRMAMKSNMVAQRQSRAVLVFTVFTIIFVRTFPWPELRMFADTLAASAFILHLPVRHERPGMEWPVYESTSAHSWCSDGLDLGGYRSCCIASGF